MPLEYLTVEHLSTKQLIRIFSKIKIHPDISFNETSCWIWQGCLVKGYGRTKLGTIRTTLHRLFFAWLVHSIPIGQQYGELDHLCRRPACCNPNHLEFVSSYVNLIRGNAPSAINLRKTHCVHGHEFTESNTYHRKDGGRKCRTCKNLTQRKREQANRERTNATTRRRYMARLEHYRLKNREKHYRRKERLSV